MKKTIIIFLSAMLLLAASLRADVSPQEKYVARYAAIAVQEMYRSGVPASITLAQGILESRYGMSALAAEGHNHFGIKCHKDWKGKSMKVDDDEKGECFRVYDEDLESFRDHSDFLRYRDRYKFLFDYDVTDYVSWANGLKKAGYATDPSYPSKLISNIEKYDLAKYDRMKPSDFEFQPSSEKALFPGKKTEAEAPAGQSADRVEKNSPKTEKAAARKARAQHKKSSSPREEPVPEVLPDSPTEMEEAVQVTETQQREEFHFTMQRPVYKQNGVPFIYAREGETYSSIAEENNLFIKEILKFNDLGKEQTLLPGTVVYIQAKKSQTEKGLDKYIVETDGEVLRDICQRFAVKMNSVCTINDFEPGHVLREGDTILLRKDFKTTGVRRLSLTRIKKLTHASNR